jgi:hypothetical protein
VAGEVILGDMKRPKMGNERAVGKMKRAWNEITFGER